MSVTVTQDCAPDFPFTYGNLLIFGDSGTLNICGAGRLPANYPLFSNKIHHYNVNADAGYPTAFAGIIVRSDITGGKVYH